MKAEQVSRKAFLRSATLGAAGLAAGAAARGQDGGEIARPVAQFDAANPEAFWREVRAQYPLTRELAYFNTGGLGPACQPALDAVAETTRRLQARAEHGHGLFAGAREVVARFIGARASEVAFVRNATEGNAIVAAGLRLAAGDEVIFETHAHPGGSFPWLQQQRRRGVVVKLFEPDAEIAEGNLVRIRKLMTRRTRVVQVSHITAPTGIVLPAARIGALCRERGVWFHLDAAQSVGMVPVDVRALGCDSLATSGHKWLGAPLETGLLWVRGERLDEVEPTLVGAYSGEIEGVSGGRVDSLAFAATGAGLKLAKTAERFEYGTRNPAAALGLAEAAKFQERIGRERIAERGAMLAEQVRAGLEGVRGVEILTPRARELRASMITFRHAKVTHDVLFGRLLKEFAVRVRPVTEEGLNALRVSTHCFNSSAECTRLVVGVGKIVDGT